MIGLVAYYLMSPLNVITLLFSPEWMPIALYIITIIKIGLCGLFFYLYLRKDSFVFLIFSTAYSLMAYNIAYASNIMWLDGVVLLPVVALGIDYIIENKTYQLYLWSLFFAIICNYYIGYMICGFSVIYFCYKLIFDDKDVQLKKKIRKSIRYFAASICAGGLSAFLLIPVKIALTESKGSISTNLISWKSNFSWRDLASKYIIGSFEAQQMNNGFPNIYCGIGILFFLLLFFVGKRYSIKEKFGAGLVLLTLLFSLKINGLNLIWHGFSYPYWFPYRESFVLGFFIILLAVKGLEQVKEWINKRKLFWYSSIICMVYIMMCIWVARAEYSYIDKVYISISIIVIILTGLCTLFYKKVCRIGVVGLLMLTCFELTLNGVKYMQCLDYTSFSYYQSEVKKYQESINYIKDMDNSFYRMEKTGYINQNDSLMWGYNGISHFSSTQNKDIVKFMGALGYYNYGNIWSYYKTGTTYANESFLGIKYLVSNKPKSYGYTEIGKSDELFIYRNEYALPVGFLTDNEIKDKKLENYSWFEGQNELWKTLSSQCKDNVFDECEIISIETSGTNYFKDNNGNSIISIVGDNPRIKYKVKMNRSAPLYGYFMADKNQQQYVKILVNGMDLSYYFTWYDYQILQLGEFVKDEIVEIEIQLGGKDLFLTEVKFFSQNMEHFEKYYKELSSQAINITNFANNRIEGIVNSHGDKQMGLFTIPYDKGWCCYIDGKKIQIEKGFDHLLAVPIEKGEHKIKFVFTPPGLKMGLIISSVFLVLIILSIVIERKERIK